jgi:hypothetical protein
MSIVYNLLVVLHLIGMASIVGSYLVVVRSPRFVPGFLHGALTQLVTGLAMVGLRESKVYDDPDGPINNTKIGVKLLIALVVTVLAWVNRKRNDTSTGVVHAIGGLALVNVFIAVLWE